MIDRLALPLAEETIPQAILAIRPHLRHHRVASAELVGGDVPVDLGQHYFAVARQAGPGYQAVRESASWEMKAS